MRQEGGKDRGGVVRGWGVGGGYEYAPCRSLQAACIPSARRSGPGTGAASQTASAD